MTEKIIGIAVIVMALSIPYLYFLIRVTARAYFEEKMQYHKYLISQLEE
jgi:hypothetical protein